MSNTQAACACIGPIGACPCLVNHGVLVERPDFRMSEATDALSDGSEWTYNPEHSKLYPWELAGSLNGARVFERSPFRAGMTPTLDDLNKAARAMQRFEDQPTLYLGWPHDNTERQTVGKA